MYGHSQTPCHVSIEAIPWLVFPDAASILSEHRPADTDIYHAFEYYVDSESGVACLDLQNPHESCTRDFRYVSENGGSMILEYAALGNADDATLSDAVAAYLPLCGINVGDTVDSLEILQGQVVQPCKRTLYSSIEKALSTDNTLDPTEYDLHWTTMSIEFPILIEANTTTFAYTLILWLEAGKVKVITIKRRR
ncbi:MAG: hypothetical protein ACI4AM_04250 [Muribaculaceae bacterium]